MSNRGYAHSHSHSTGQARAGAEYAYANGLAHQTSHEDLKRTNSAASQRQRQPAPAPNYTSRVLAEPSQSSSRQVNGHNRDDSGDMGKKRARKSPVDWVAYFGGKPPTEIITIHDDDSPAPPEQKQKLPGPATGGSTSHHVDKKRRTNAAAENAYSATNTPYSNSHGASTDSLQNTTAPTSLGSNMSSSSRLDGAKTGEKRKRTQAASRTTDQDRKKQETGSGPRGYLAEYGEYLPPPKQQKKQKEVTVPTIHDRYKTNEPIDDDDGHYIVHENSRLGERYSLLQLLGQGTFGKVVKAIDNRTRREVAVKIIRAVPKVCSIYSLENKTATNASYSAVP
jgi:dual-specificity kinase